MGSSAARCSSPSGGGCRLRQVREKVRPAPPRANPHLVLASPNGGGVSRRSPARRLTVGASRPCANSQSRHRGGGMPRPATSVPACPRATARVAPTQKPPSRRGPLAPPLGALGLSTPFAAMTEGGARRLTEGVDVLPHRQSPVPAVGAAALGRPPTHANARPRAAEGVGPYTPPLSWLREGACAEVEGSFPSLSHHIRSSAPTPPPP